MTNAEAYEILSASGLTIEGNAVKVAQFFEALAFARDMILANDKIECEDVSRFRGVFECSACHWTDEDIGTADPIRFCAGCGAKVKGGESK